MLQGLHSPLCSYSESAHVSAEHVLYPAYFEIVKPFAVSQFIQDEPVGELLFFSQLKQFSSQS